MLVFSLSFLLGIILLQQFSVLPDLSWLAFSVTLLLLFYGMKKFWKNGYLIVAGIILGFSWCLFYSHQQLMWDLPGDLEGKPITITGYISSIPQKNLLRSHFNFTVKSIILNNKPVSFHSMISLSDEQNKLKLGVGEEWQFSAKLKKIHGNSNPGGFDYEAWAFQEGLRANGYIINKSTNNSLLSNHYYHYTLARIREYLRDQIEKNLAASQTSHWIPALAIGERQGISINDWQVLQNTGTNHLMAIAGLHIGFMCAFIFTLVSWVWRRFPVLLLKIPAQQMGYIASFFMAIFYSALAGFSIPTIRASCMISLFLLTKIVKRNILIDRVFGCALLVVLMLNPLSVLTTSLWLSFGSVALIIYAMGNRYSLKKNLWWKWGRLQWVTAIGIIPLSVWLFQQLSWVSFIANSIAIPWIGFLVVPLTLIGSLFLLFSNTVGGFILLVADKLLQIIWIFLSYLSHLPWAAWNIVVPSYIIIGLLISLLLFLAPVGFPGKWFGIIGILSFFLYKAPQPERGEIWFTLLDVGQGLSAVIQTSHHTLVFDTGARLSEDFDMGRNVVLPFLRTQGINTVDSLIISHADNDHSGGASAILNTLSVKELKTSVPNFFPAQQALLCLAGEQWEWDDVHYKFLYPDKSHLGLNNDSSCVLKITTGTHSILLAGDIEKVAEHFLVDTNAPNLATTILVAPHHGSKTSALNDFIEWVNPKTVLFAVGYRNRYHFPHPTVVKKYQEKNVARYDSVHDGAIQFRFKKTDMFISDPYLYRINTKKYWNN